MRGKKRACEDIERYCLAEYDGKLLPSGDYELKVPYSSDDHLDQRMHELLGDIASQADDRHCFSERGKPNSRVTSRHLRLQPVVKQLFGDISAAVLRTHLGMA